MEYAATVLAILGLAVGLRFRLKVLLPILAILLVASAAYAIILGYDFADTALVMLAAQGVMQFAYFIGILVRSVISPRPGRPKLGGPPNGSA